MKIKLFISLCLTIVLLTACSGQRTLTFQGKTDNWQIKYQVDKASKNSESDSGYIRYIGNGEPPKNISYKIDSPSGGSDGNNIKLKNGAIHFSGSSCSGCAVTSKNDNIKIKIEWNGKSENITLINK